MYLRLTPLLALLATGSAAASSVTNEVISNSIQATDTTPRASMLTNWLNASFDVTDDFALYGGLSLSYQSPTAAANRAQFGESGSLVTLMNLGFDWAATESWTLGVNLTGSPRSTQYAGMPVQYQTSTGTLLSADALVQSQTWQAGAELNLAWDTAGMSDLEWSIDGAIGYSHFDIDQSVPEIRRRTTTGFQTISTATLQQDCQARPRAACTSLLNALNGTPVQQDFERLSAAVTATIFRDTDLTLGGDYYVYQQDPSQIGFFGLAAAGRGPGLPIAPLQFMVRPEVLHRFGDFSARLWVQAGEYVAGTGYGTAGVGTKLQYRFSKAWRAWATASGTRDVDETNAITRSVAVSLGLGYRW